MCPRIYPRQAQQARYAPCSCRGGISSLRGGGGRGVLGQALESQTSISSFSPHDNPRLPFSAEKRGAWRVSSRTRSHVSGTCRQAENRVPSHGLLRDVTAEFGQRLGDAVREA